MSLYTLNLGLKKMKQTSKTQVDANIDFIFFLISQRGKTPLIPFAHGRGAQLQCTKFQPAGRLNELSVRA